MYDTIPQVVIKVKQEKGVTSQSSNMSQLGAFQEAQAKPADRQFCTRTFVPLLFQQLELRARLIEARFNVGSSIQMWCSVVAEI